VASTVVAVFQVAAITGEVPASAAIAAVGIVMEAAGTEVRHWREDPDLEDLGSEDLGSGDRDSDDLDLEDLGLEDSGTLVASPPAIARQLLTGGGIRLEGSAVGLVEATALAVALGFGAASVNAAFLVVVASAAGAADLGSALAGGSVGILSGIGHLTGIARGGSTIIILTRSSRDGRAPRPGVARGSCSPRPRLDPMKMRCRDRGRRGLDGSEDPSPHERCYLRGCGAIAGFVEPSGKTVQQDRRPEHRNGEKEVALGGSAEERNRGGVGHHQAAKSSGIHLRRRRPYCKVTDHEERD